MADGGDGEGERSENRCSNPTCRVVNSITHSFVSQRNIFWDILASVICDFAGVE